MNLQTPITKHTIDLTMKKPSGQIAIVLLLFVLVALTIGLTVTQRSLTNISTSSQTEQVSRAFSAAEAGLERSLNQIQVTSTAPLPGAQDISQADLNNQASANVKVATKLPRTGQALEYPPVGKDTFAQFWLVDPSTLTSNGLSGIKVYYGRQPLDEPTNPPAIELNIIAKDSSGNYILSRNFYDSTTNANSARKALNGFNPSSACAVGSIPTSNSINATDLSPTSFLCRIDLSFAAGSVPMMIRARILYSNVKQPLAVLPASCSTPPCSLPVQAAIYTSTGTAGQSQKTIQVFRQVNFMPSFLDFAIFSSGSINKQ